jgi:MinD-like ATPase involved in chromosome partitioning or flagellar assembly
MFTVCYSPKGGQGCTAATATLALLETDALVIDVGGDLPALLGLPEPHVPGICDLLTDTAPVDLATLTAITIEIGTIRLIPTGLSPAHEVPAERWTELANLLAADGRAVFLDAGTNTAAASAAADRRLLVVRACYIALRRAIALPVQPDMAIVLVEPGRALSVADIESALGVPVAAEIPIDPAVARAIDAGLFAARLPTQLRRALGNLAVDPQAGASCLTG